MKRLIHVLLLFALGGCTHLQTLAGNTVNPKVLWGEAHAALAVEDFPTSEAIFERIARDFPGTIEARESTFYLGTIRLDPRNPEWDPGAAEEHLTRYLAGFSDGGPRLYRYPEALTMHEVARQLNLPPDSRMEGLQPERQVVTIEQRVIVPAEQSQELATEIEVLRQQLIERDERIQAQQEEIERIRRTLTPVGP